MYWNGLFKGKEKHSIQSAHKPTPGGAASEAGS